MLDAISALVDKSMCTVDLGATPTRYRYLETMRSYGRDHLQQVGDTRRLPQPPCRPPRRLSTSSSARRSSVPDELEASRQAERLIADLRAALGWAVDRHLDDVIDGIAALAVPMVMRGFYEMTGWFYDLRDDLPDQPSVQAAAMQLRVVTAKATYAEARRLWRTG